ncbi:DUF4013 domain-containing protein [Collinsella sp. AGMB00827]|uniref:DUF4013 domain-containing protein n=1 Tax=Collinsella ureilytica TaxID=2869515 RepID=A0ABS7MK93_9ACTN|nr:DUF4013 domain-containing protein [Collinsella urealyticum]MBY4797789.1 DUF4013 domain-containing protein [Collinsella urealyticum]
MQAQNPSFMSSWKSLTRDKGWIKPVLILAVLSWIPIFGSIVFLGFANEWARLSAWGVNSAPKQSGVDRNKILTTGVRVFLVRLSMGCALAIIQSILLFHSFDWLSLAYGNTDLLPLAFASKGLSYAIVAVVFNSLISVVIMAASLRAVLYDRFQAGWRLDRIFEMISRDVRGFFKTYLVAVIAGVIAAVFAAFVSFLAIIAFSLFLMNSLSAAFIVQSAELSSSEFISLLSRELLTSGGGAVMGLVVLGIVVLFIGAVLNTALNLVTVHAVGQWFSRFDVEHWGKSEDPLPAGVPVQVQQASTAPTEPAQPVTPVAPTVSKPTEDVNVANVASSATPTTNEQATTVLAPEAAGDAQQQDGVEKAEETEGSQELDGDAQTEHIVSPASSLPLPQNDNESSQSCGDVSEKE